MSRTERPPAVRNRRSCWKTFTARQMLSPVRAGGVQIVG
jgi:hypothetical protein